MIPLRDTTPSRRFPAVTVGLIVLNVAFFLWELSLGPALERFIHTFGLIPARFVYWTEAGGSPFDPMRFLPLFSSMFLHAGWLHLIGNMLYLWIFGDNVEERLGHLRFLLFYLMAGVAGSLAHIGFSPGSTLPTLGASGAIAGVLGAYLVLFPHGRVLTLIPILFFPLFIEVPVLFYLALWFLMQLIQGTTALTAATAEDVGGVAWWAHIGGFVAGLGIGWLLRARRRPSKRPPHPPRHIPPHPWEHRPSPYRW